MADAITNVPAAAPFAASADPTVRRQHRGTDVGVDLDGGSIAVAFDTLLATVHTVWPDVRSGAGANVSPSQMFEPAAADAHERRQAALKHEYRASAGKVPDDRLDPAGIDARRAARAGRADGPRGRPPDGRIVRRNAGGEPGRPSADSRAGPYGDTLLTADAARAVTLARRLQTSTARSAGAFRAASPQGGGGAAPLAPLLYGAASARSGAAVPISPAAMPGGAGKPSPAQQTAQLLSAGRVTPVDSVRSVESSSAADHMRQGGADQRSQTRSASEQQADGASAAKRSAYSAGKAAALRSAFDRLVRSIRLRTGARHSSARLRLEPPELGRLHVDVRVDGERLRIDVRTETLAARHLVSERAAQLAAALEQHGIHVERFNVTTGPGADHSAAAHDGGSGSQETAGGGREQSGEHSGTAAAPTNPVSPDDISAPAAHDGGQQTELAAETRLDIRA